MKYRYNGSVMDERLEVFLNMLAGDIPEYLQEITSYAESEHVPIMRKQTAELLKFIIKSHETEKILEVGTAIGFSALSMSECECVKYIETIEKVPVRIIEAKKNFEKYDKNKMINLIEGDAADILKGLSSNNTKYDLIFMDAAKGQYPAFLLYINTLLDKGGILVTDNVLQEGLVLESRYAVDRRDRTIHSRMREYLYTLTHSEEWDTIIIPSGDGIAVSIRQ